MPAYTIDGNDDIIAGTPDADTVTGTTGGNDQIDLGGGDDVATIDRIAFFIYDLVDPFNDYWEYFYTGMDSPYQGVLAGGAGRDTLDVGTRTDPPNASPYYFRVEPFSLRETELSGFEVLNLRWQAEMSVAQLAGFDEIGGMLSIQLFGSGGTLDLGAKTILADSSAFNARGLTSGLRFTGSDRSDTVYDSAHNDHLVGGLGNDTFHYSGGVDYFAGGDGFDTLVIEWTGPTSLELETVGVQSTISNGTHFVGFERYDILGGTQADEIAGGGGNDTLRGNAGDDVLYGLGGDDQLFGGFVGNGSKMGIDTLYGGDGKDALYVDGDSLGYGGAGRDTLSGRNGGNALYGGADNDLLTTRGGDRLFGDAGDDRLVVTDAGGAELHGGAGNDALVVDVSASYPGSSQLYGDDGDDLLTGDTTQERLDGGRGTDEMRGGLGDDTYVVDRPEDVIIELANQGADTVEVRYSYILGADLENLLLTGTADANGWGNAAANMLTGNDADNRLNGLGGGDTMAGGKGNDIYVVNHAGDQIVESNAQGSDTALSSIDYTLGTAVEHLTLLGSADRAATGNTGANRLTGNAGDNLITGNGGADVLKGNLGADTFRYLALSDSRSAATDRIDDFNLSQGDVVDISAIDADAGVGGDQAFDAQIGAGTTFSVAGQYRFSAVSGGFLAEFNAGGDADAEFAIRFLGATAPQSDWFLL